MYTEDILSSFVVCIALCLMAIVVGQNITENQKIMENKERIAEYLDTTVSKLDSDCEAYKYDTTMNSEYYNLVCTYEMENAVKAKTSFDNKIEEN